MKFKIPSGERWVPVNSVAGEFEILVRRPTAEQRMFHTAIASGSPNPIEGARAQNRYRIENAVVDWRGITQDVPGSVGQEKDVPFSREAMDAILGAYPDIYDAVTIAAAEGWSKKSYEEPKAGVVEGN